MNNYDDGWQSDDFIDFFLTLPPKRKQRQKLGFLRRSSNFTKFICFLCCLEL